MQFLVGFLVAGILLGLYEAVRFLTEVTWDGAGTLVAGGHVVLLAGLVGMLVGAGFASLRRAADYFLGIPTLIPLVVASLYFVAFTVPPLQMLLSNDFNNPLLLALVMSLVCAGAGIVAAFVAAATMRLERHGPPWRFVPHLFLALGMVGFYFWFRKDIALVGSRLLRPGLILFHLGVFASAGLSRWGSRLLAPVASTARRTLLLAVMVGLNGLLICTPQWQPRFGLALEKRAPLANSLLETAASLLDFDDDGFSSFLGEGDCQPDDPDIHPAAQDIPGNGIDENCDGEDAEASDFSLRQPRAYRPYAPHRKPYNLLLITVDALRRDHLGSYGYHRDTSPEIDRLAARSTRFANAFSATPNTLYSLTGILYGLPIAVVHWEHPTAKRIAIPRTRVSLASVLQKNGFNTLAVLDCFRAFKPFFGLGQGFDTYDRSSVCVNTFRVKAKKADERTDAVIDYLRRLEDDDDRFFLWVHYLEPHGPYTQPPGIPPFGPEEIDKYDTVVKWTDQELGRLFRYLEKSGLAENTIIVLTGDHGEEFEEHGGTHHGKTLYTESVGVPLIIHVPDLEPGVRQEPVGHLDIMPTVLDLLGIYETQWPRIYGRNLLPLLMGRTWSEIDYALVMNTTKRQFNRLDLALYVPPFALIRKFKKKAYEFYNIETDYLQQTNLYDPDDPDFRRLRALLDHVAYSLGEERGEERGKGPFDDTGS